LIAFYSFISVFLGWLVQGFIGFGSGIVSTILLVLFFDMKEIIISLSVTALVGTFLLAVKSYRGKFFLNQSIPILTLSFLGAFVGSLMLDKLNLKFVEFVFGFVVLISGVYDFLYQKGKIKSLIVNNQKLFLFITGFFGGIMSGLIGASGPIHVLYFNQVIKDKEHYKFVVSFIFAVLNVERIFFYLLNENLRVNFNEYILIYGIPATIVGMYVGDTLSKKIDTQLFKELVSISISLAGLFFIIKALLDFVIK